MRIGEVVKINKSAVRAPSADEGSHLGFIALPKTKTGLNQSARIESEVIWHLLGEYLRNNDNDSVLLFPRLSGAYVTTKLKRMCTKIGVNYHITAHCLRHGGATDDYINNTPMADILQRGRWRSEKSAARYVQSSRSLLLAVKLPEVVRLRGEWIQRKPMRLIKNRKQ
jgi:integrase